MGSVTKYYCDNDWCSQEIEYDTLYFTIAIQDRRGFVRTHARAEYCSRGCATDDMERLYEVGVENS